MIILPKPHNETVYIGCMTENCLDDSYIMVRTCDAYPTRKMFNMSYEQLIGFLKDTKVSDIKTSIVPLTEEERKEYCPDKRVYEPRPEILEKIIQDYS